LYAPISGFGGFRAFIAHLRTSQSFLAIRETEDVVAINTFRTFEVDIRPERFTVSDSNHIPVALH